MATPRNTLLVTIGLLVDCLWTAEGARTRINAEMLAVSDTDGNLANCDQELHKYTNLAARFENLVYAGAGANGCVVLANDMQNGGVKVAIKLAKGNGKSKMQEWKKECERTKAFHKKACEAEKTEAPEYKGLQLKLSERFLPDCLEVGGDDAAPYIIMHAAGGEGIRGGQTLRRSVPGKEDRISVFAQIVGALASLHGIHMSHNDLHDNNVVYLHKGEPTTIALIDFGETVALERGQYTWSYKQDETLILRKAQELADCPGQAHQKPPTDKAVLLSCLHGKWSSEGADEEFLTALGEAYDEAKSRDRNPKWVLKLFKTAFIQKYLPWPTMDSLFPNTECSGGDVQEVTETAESTLDVKKVIDEERPAEPKTIKQEISSIDDSNGADVKVKDEPTLDTEKEVALERSPDCKKNPGCAHLSGRCCPAKSGMMLACCNKK